MPPRRRPRRTRSPRDRARFDGAVRLALSGGAETVAAVPYLLGFVPDRSLVVLALRGRPARLVVTMRVDLPGVVAGAPGEPEETRPADAADYAAEIAAAVRGAGADRAVLVLYPGDLDLPGAVVPSLVDALEVAGVHVVEAYGTAGSGWWSYLCEDPTGCVAAGGLLGGGDARRVAELLAAQGLEVVGDRDRLGAEVLPSEDLIPEAALESAACRVMDRLEVTAWLDRDGAGVPPEWARRELEALRDESIATTRWLLGLSADGRAAPERWAHHDDLVADLAVVLRDVRVRDTVLWHVAHAEPTALRRMGEELRAAVRRLPAGAVAAVATLAAACTWLLGDGARTRVLVDRALADDPDYTLARLLEQSMRAMLPPSAWAESLREVGWEQCRYGPGGARSA